MKRQLALAFGIFTAIPTWAAPAQPGQTLPPPPSSPPPAAHVVQPGDNLEKIARLHSCRVADLMAANQLKPDSLIFPGQKLSLPTPTAPKQEVPATTAAVAPATHAAPAAPAAPAIPSPDPGPTHKVAPGETFASIARQHGIPLDVLLAANPEVKPTALRPGQNVRLGQAATTANTPAPTQDPGATQMILASKADNQNTPHPAKPLASPTAVKIQSIRIDRPMTYLEFASRQGTNTRRLNQLNGLDLLDSALLAGGTELLAPAQP